MKTKLILLEVKKKYGKKPHPGHSWQPELLE